MQSARCTSDAKPILIECARPGKVFHDQKCFARLVPLRVQSHASANTLHLCWKLEGDLAESEPGRAGATRGLGVGRQAWKTVFPWKITFDGCLGREVAIAFEEINGDGRIHLKYAEALPGCADSTIRIRKVNENEMTGTRWGKRN